MNTETKKKISSTMRSLGMTRNDNHREQMSLGMKKGQEFGGKSIAHLKREKTLLLREYKVTKEQELLVRIEELECEIAIKEDLLWVDWKIFKY